MSEKFNLAYPPEKAQAYLAFENDQHLADVLIENALQSLDIHNQNVLDYGAGFGRMIPMLLRQGVSKVTGCDPSPSMVEEAKRRLEGGNLGDSSKVELLTVKDFPLPFPSDSFDGILSRFVFHYVADTKTMFEELARVTRPGGWLVAIFSDVHVKKGSEHLLNTHLPLRFLDNLTIDTLVKSGEEVVKDAKAAGFTIERFENPTDATVVTIDDSYEHKDEIERFDTGFLIARKAG